MKFDLDDWHDAILVSDRYEPDGSLVLDFEEPYRRAADSRFLPIAGPKSGTPELR